MWPLAAGPVSTTPDYPHIQTFDRRRRAQSGSSRGRLHRCNRGAACHPRYPSPVIDPLFQRDPDVIQDPESEGPVLTDEMVLAAERSLGVTLPESYVELMRKCNGGYTNDAAMGTPQPTSWAPDHVPVDMIFGIPAVSDLGQFGTGLGIIQTAYMTQEWDLPRGLVLLNGDGHWWIGLDYRESGPKGPPTVVWINIDRNEDIQLAENFAAFREQLMPAKSFESSEDE